MTPVETPPDHDRTKCGANTRSGHPCGRPAGWGTEHPGIGTCKLHGGSTTNHNKAAAVVQAQRDVELFAARRDIHPAEALLELVQWTAGEVDYWRQRVTQLEEDDLTWGTTKVKTGGDDRGTTEEAKPNIAYAMLVDASNRLERYSSAALKANIDERRVRLAESEGRVLAGVIQRILTRIFDALVERLGAVEARQVLESAWPELVAEIVPSELRAIAAGTHPPTEGEAA